MNTWRKIIVGYGTANAKAFQPTLRSGEFGVLGKQDQYGESRDLKDRLGQGPGKTMRDVTGIVSVMMPLVDFSRGVILVF